MLLVDCRKLALLCSVVQVSIAMALIKQQHHSSSSLGQVQEEPHFPFVHPLIADTLKWHRPNTENKATGIGDTTAKANGLLDTNSLDILAWPNQAAASQDNSSSPSNVHVLSQDQKNALIQLAHECDDFVFCKQPSGLSKFISQQEANNYNDDSKNTLYKLIEWGRGDRDHDGTDSASPADDDIKNAQCLLASLLALNRLEAAIRLATGYTSAGRAPLLKTMIGELQQQHKNSNHTAADNTSSTAVNSRGSSCGKIAQVLQTLLLPNPGLNLRNLLWHGFVASLPRPWLALVLVLIVRLEQQGNGAEVGSASTSVAPANELAGQDEQTKLQTWTKYSQWEPLIRHGDNLLQGNLLYQIDMAWISPHFHPWWELIKSWNQRPRETSLTLDQQEKQQHQGCYPLCTCILLTCILEHGLRQVWCQLNNRPEDQMARPGAFYVTLDGHGQRHQHDVLLHPYVGVADDANKATADGATGIGSCNNTDAEVKNQLIEYLDGPLAALLADLYCSPCGGPNLRASLAHGLWDQSLQKELLTSAKFGTPQSNFPQESSGDMVRILLTLFEELGKLPSSQEATAINSDSKAQLSASPLKNYFPLFSYTSATCRNLDSAIQELDQLHQHFKTTESKELLRVAKASTKLPLETLQNLQIDFDELRQQATRTKQMCGYSAPREGVWASQDVFLEHESNRILISSGAARLLLLEVADACSSFRETLEAASTEQGDADSPALSSRQRRQRLRIIASTELVTLVYTFAASAALTLIDFELSSAGAKIASVQSGQEIDRGLLLQGVKRSRMVVSTVFTFISANPDRAMKSAKEFSNGKAVKALVIMHQQQIKSNDS